MKLLGKIKWFNDERGYGFIIHEEKDYFLHARHLKDEYGTKPTLLPGMAVAFTPIEHPKGTQATDVDVIEADGNR